MPESHHGGGRQGIIGVRRDNGNLQYRTFINSHQGHDCVPYGTLQNGTVLERERQRQGGSYA